MAHYVDNKKLFGEMCVFVILCAEAKECGDPRPRVPEYVGECIYRIANNLSTRPNFIGYTYRDEMIGDGIENCLTYLHNFNPEKSSNPFAYFTQIIYYAFLRRIQKEKKQLYIKYKSFENSLIDQTLFDVMTHDPGFGREGTTRHNSFDPLPYGIFDLSYDAGNSLTASIPRDKMTELVNMFEPPKLVKQKLPKGIEKFIEQEENHNTDDIR